VFPEQTGLVQLECCAGNHSNTNPFFSSQWTTLIATLYSFQKHFTNILYSTKS